jgi:hypothetical protein
MRYPVRDRTERLANVLADAEVAIVIAQPVFSEAGHMPELGIARVEIDEYTAAEPWLERFARQVPADVDEHLGCLRSVQQLLQGVPMLRLSPSTMSAAFSSNCSVTAVK